MSDLLLNNELSLPVPDGFHVMTDEECKGMNIMGDGKWVGLSDPERHILVIAGWKQPPAFALMLLSEKDLAKNMEKQIGSALQPAGYASEGFTEKVIAGTKACGAQYRYTASGTEMVAASYSMKFRKKTYYFHFYGREALREESITVWNEMLESISAR